MLRNYFKIALRVFKKEKSFTSINLLCLATGFAITILIVQYVRYEFSYEKSHENADRIVRLTIDYMDGETISTQDCETYPPIGPKTLAEIPEVIDFSRAYPIGEPNTNVKIGKQQFVLEKVFAADSSFFSMFTYPLIYGTKKNLFKMAGEAVISETTAKRLFNRADVVGETIEMPDGDSVKLFTVMGVTADSPSNTHLKFDMVFSYLSMYAEPILYGEIEDNWNGNNTLTYLLLAPNANYQNFTSSLKGFNQRLKDEEKMLNSQVVGQKISDIHLYSKKTFETEVNGDSTTVFFLLGVALLVIISAFVNYVNLATSKALDRAKEVGLRKVVGSTRGQLKTQFLIEALLINMFAGFVALVFILLIKSKFIEISGLPANLIIFGEPFFWICLFGFMGLSMVCSGVYPALVLSSFKPVSVLKGSFSRSTHGALLRKYLVVFQFAITIILLVQAFTVYEQLNYIRDTDLGVDIDRILVVVAPAEKDLKQNYSVFKEQLLSRANVSAVSLSGTVPGQSTSQFGTTTGINLSEAIQKHEYNFYINEIDADYISTMGMGLLAGQNFLSTSNSENNELIVNEEAIRLWGLSSAEEAVGKELSFWGQSWTIHGVIKDYYQETAKSAQIPIIHRFNNNSFDNNASIQFSGGNPKEHIAEIESIYKATFPGAPFTYFFQDGEYDKLYRGDEIFQKVFGVLTAFAILIACLGLFGLASFTVAKRTKEIGIRKVIGASTASVLVSLSFDFIKTVLISILIGVPVTYFIVKSWLDNFANRIDISWPLFAVPIVLVLMLVLLSIGVKTIKTAMANPVESLKYE